MSLRVLKWNVAVDDQPHEVGYGRVLHVACQYGPESVQVWTLELSKPHTRLAQVFGTGQPLPDTVAAHLGSTVAAHALVWHVFEVWP